MTPFAIAAPARILFGRGEAARAPALIRALGPRGLVVHGAAPARSGWLLDALQAEGAAVLALPCGAEPTLPMLETALQATRAHAPDWVAAIGGGAALANAGLGAVHGLAGVIGGLCPAPHGAICGALLAPVLWLNRTRATGEAAARPCSHGA